jgi:GntR family transcriptional regulator
VAGPVTGSTAGREPTPAEVGLRRGSLDVLHEQLAGQLRELAGTLPEGASLPSESELMRRHGVSRTTVRRALKTLVAEGLLARRQGVGTFVAPRRVGHPLTDLGGFVEAFTRHGLEVDCELAAFGWAQEPSAFPAGAPAQAGGGLVFRRIYRVDATVWAVADCCVFGQYGAAISRSALQRRPSFELLQDEFGSPIVASEISVGLGEASSDVAALLDVRPGAAVLRLRRLLTGRDGAPVQYAVYYVPADRFEFTVKEPVSSPVATGHAVPRLRLLPGADHPAEGAGRRAGRRSSG